MNYYNSDVNRLVIQFLSFCFSCLFVQDINIFDLIQLGILIYPFNWQIFPQNCDYFFQNIEEPVFSSSSIHGRIHVAGPLCMWKDLIG